MNEMQAARVLLTIQAEEAARQAQRASFLAAVNTIRREFKDREKRATQGGARQPRKSSVVSRPMLPNSRPSPYRGVSWNRRDSLWVARIKVQQKSITLGVYLPDRAEDAARAYDYAARLYFGDQAITNFPTVRDASHTNRRMRMGKKRKISIFAKIRR